jgi:predicted phage tail protein
MALSIEYTPRVTVRLYGALRRFGKQYELVVRSPAEAVRALCVQIPGFEKFLSSSKEAGLVYAVFRGKQNVAESELCFQGRGDIRIAPVMVGNKRAGALQTVIGAVLIVVGLVITTGTVGAGAPFGSALILMGASMALGGVIQMLSPQAKGLKTSAAPENTPGYAFGSAQNTTASGNPVALACGRRRWGGAIISASIYAEDQV